MTRRATAVVPVKRLDLAKSRLALADEHRRDLALAFALDTVAALAASTRVAAVVVVTGDAVVAQQVEALGARVVPDRGRDLVASVRTGTRARQADPHAWVVVVPGDLPCLRAADVDRRRGGGARPADRCLRGRPRRHRDHDRPAGARRADRDRVRSRVAAVTAASH
ncbi:NTP transferase domain-containing protein [Nocardioides okcheonensis]|uniref:NTP transferase domain-containing protein n=1 Tax=Nocardioides okcheonensis TaxID=2894081 RepID=UPI001E2B0426|nr:NTP transferase domain-containing protein [Nocardioides okcheonensis]UFN42965.1 NTP transferase domain-containing protein [Nocardioides okcheonensis]